MVCPGIHLIHLYAPEITETARPGQFIMVKCASKLTLRRPLSIHRTDRNGTLSMLFAVTGKGTLWLSQRNPGEILDIFGPMGNGFILPAGAQRILLVAGGIGIAPLAFLSQEALIHGKDVTLLQGAVTSESLFHVENILREADIVYTTDDGSLGHKGIVTDILPDHLYQADRVYACGPLPMYKSISQVAAGLSISIPIDISLEVRMGCGMGTCYGCSIRTRQGMKRVCLDGPVFNLHDIIWEEIQL